MFGDIVENGPAVRAVLRQKRKQIRPDAEAASKS